MTKNNEYYDKIPSYLLEDSDDITYNIKTNLNINLLLKFL